MLRELRILAALLLAVTVTPVWAHDPARLPSRLDRLEVTVAPVASAPSPGMAGGTPSEAWAVARLSRDGVTPSAVETLAVLVVALGLAGLARSWRRDRRAALASAAAGLLLGFVVATTPHLVHHSLDGDQGAGCQALQAAERCHAAVGGLDVAPGGVCAPLDEPSSFVAGPTRFAPAPCGRAPPA